MSEHPARPRERNVWVVCEDSGALAYNGQCEEHGGDACLIVVGWVDNSHVRRGLVERTAERDRWIRLFNRLDKACSDAIERNPDDDALAAAHRAVMKEAAA